jgi:hypothetical protein
MVIRSFVDKNYNVKIGKSMCILFTIYWRIIWASKNAMLHIEREEG